MFERFARAARSAVDGARQEAAHRGDRRIGTEHLLLALLHDAASARIVGISAARASDAAAQLDRDALAAIGITGWPLEPTSPAPLGRHSPRMTPGAKTVLQQALMRASTEKSRAITTRHLLLAVLDRDEPDPAATLLAALSVDRAVLRNRLIAA